MPAALTVGAVALVSSGFLFGSTPDEEEFRFAILSSWLHTRALLHGDYGLWSSLPGLGVPQPLTPNFWLHPLLPLLPLVGPVLWVRLLLLTHTVLGATGMWQLTKRLALAPMTRAVCVCTFLLAAPICNYVFTDFFPSHYVVWTSMPWLVVLMWRTLDADRQTIARRSVALGLCAGLVVANTNPGHVLAYTTLVVGLALTNARRLAARWRWIALAVTIAAAIAGPNLAQLAHERSLFDPTLSVDELRDPVSWSSVQAGLTAPMRTLASPSRRIDPAVARTMFFGAPFTVLGLAGCLLFARRRSDFAATLLMSAVLVFTRMLWIPFASARFQFRDPLTLAAIPLAGLAVDRLLAKPRWRAVAIGILALQVTAAALTMWPFLLGTWGDDARAGMWFRGATGAREHVDQVLTLMPSAGRVVFSPGVDREVYNKGRLQEGFGVNALAFRGVPLVNGWFKGVSTASIWPDERMFYARIVAPRAFVESKAALDALGVRYVLANDDEVVAPALLRRGVVPKRDNGSFVVYENAAAWPAAFLLDSASERLELPVQSGCGNDRLLCRDFSGLAAHRLADGVTVEQHDGSIDVEVVDSAQARLLVVSQMFRRDWVATDGNQPLSAMPAFGALIGVHVPAHVTSVRLRYRPTSVMLTTIIAWCALLASVLVLVTASRGRFSASAATPNERTGPASARARAESTAESRGQD